MKKHSKLFITLGIIFTVMFGILKLLEPMHSVLHFDPLPENSWYRWLVFIVSCLFVAFITFIIKGYIFISFCFDEPKKIKTKFSPIDDIDRADKEGQYEKVINIGTTFCRTLYIEGHHKLRYEIGKIIEVAAIKTHNKAVQIETYIDYIGWSLVLMKSFENIKAIEYINHGIQLAMLDPQDHFWIAKGTRHLGAIKFIEHDYKNAEKIFNEALVFADGISEIKQKKEMIAGINFDLALLNLILNDTTKARSFCEYSRKLREEVKDKTRICRMFALEGKIAEAENDDISAKNFFTQGLEYSRQLNRRDEIIRNHIGLSRILKDDNIEKAKEHLEEARKLLKDTDAPIDIYGKEEIPLL